MSEAEHGSQKFAELPIDTRFYLGDSPNGAMKILHPSGPVDPMRGDTTGNVSRTACAALALNEVCCDLRLGKVKRDTRPLSIAVDH